MTDPSILDAPPTPPEPHGDARFELARQYLHGEGLEIGALHLALLMPPTARVRYVDRMPVSELREHYPELAELDLAPVDIIDDGEHLHSVQPESQDFIVANHFLEHCQDPIGTLAAHLSKLRPGAVVFYAIPDKRYTFDHPRARTTLEHLIADHEQGPEQSRSQHYVEWAEAGVAAAGQTTGREEILARAAQIEREDYSIHFHVWTDADLAELFFHCQERFRTFEVEAFRRHGIENIFVLRKHGRSAGGFVGERTEPARPATATGAPSARSGSSASPVAVPLAGLRARLDEGTVRAHWSIDPDGVQGRAWVISTDSPVTVPLGLDGPLTLTARARLTAHDWRDGVGGVEAWMQALTAAGERHRLWASALTSAADPDGVTVQCIVPADTAELRIGASKRGPESGRSIQRFLLVEPYLAVEPYRAGGESADSAVPTAAVVARPTDGPAISVLCPVHDPPAEMLQAAIDSVVAQTYENWQLVLADDGSSDPLVRALLAERAASDARIELVSLDHSGGISTATNAALSRAAGDYVATLDHDDLLDPRALARIAETLARDPDLDMVYTDEAVLEDGHVTARHLKTSWSPETIQVRMYTTHLAVYRRSLADELGGWRSCFDGSQDYDFVLRLGERTDRIAHIPEVLYLWRAHSRSVAAGEDVKPYAYAIQPRIVADHLRRTGVDAEVQFGPRPGRHRIVHRVDPAVAVSIVLVVRDMSALPRVAGALAAQPHRNFEAVVSAPGELTELSATKLRQHGVNDFRISLVATDPAHTPAQALCAAAGQARGDHLLLMERPMLGLSHDWLRRLVGYAAQPGIAAATPVVLTEDGRIAHAGLALPAGLPLPLLHGLPAAAAPEIVLNAAAADGVIAVSSRTLHRLGGLDPEQGSMPIADLCLRADRDLGLRTMVLPDVRMHTLGADDTVNDLPALLRLGARWSARHGHDPYYSPRFRTDRGDFVPTV